jgi:SAM-dependent methyltransferase
LGPVLRTDTQDLVRGSRQDHVIRRVVGPHVLDLGCSGGAFSSADRYWLHGYLRFLFPDTTWGLELDPDNVDRMRATGYTNIYQGDAQDFQLDQVFDTVVAGEIIEHVERPGDLLRAAASHLKPSGRIIVTTPNPFAASYFSYALFRYPKTCANPEHVAWFCPTTMTQLAQRVGLKVDEWLLVPSYRLDLGGSTLYRLGAVAFRLFGWLLPMRLRHNHLLFVLSSP